MTEPFTSFSLALARAKAEGQPLFSAWSLFADVLVARAVASGPFDAVLIDAQHGHMDFAAAQAMTAAIHQADKVPLLRIPVGDFAFVSRALDFGVQGIVAPMINTAAEAQALVNAAKYTPVGERSFGPFGACSLYGTDAANYAAKANGACLVFAMVETERALDNLDDILAVEGLDGVFVGPADLSLTLMKGERVDMDCEMSNKAYKLVADKAAEAGKFSGIYAFSVAYAKRYAGFGFNLIAVGSDSGYLAAGMQQVAADLKG
ncbi:aldolase/citrate lyase family protein [uncultured Cohaesibacter sp.]|uniref:HpcH/HpaI aldolase family protein n=1 Tax=uncultured Cohaesibacter sp. TaxID=1002546 RepID=UPI0029C69577|nr:aldolase/citrate lyase family protein [uncultured Cohaesibacter sp.]